MDWRNWEDVKERLRIKLVSVKGNEEHLQSVPHRRYEDIAMIYRIEIYSRDGERAYATVDNKDLIRYKVSEEELQKANREHKCDLCGTSIKAGEMYWRITGKWYYGFYDTKLHKPCNALVEKYYDSTQEWEWDKDSVREWIADEVCSECAYGKDPDYYSFGDWEECPYSFESTPQCPVVLRYFKIDRRSEYEQA